MKKTFFISLFLPLLVACQESDSDEGLSDWVSLSREGLTAIVINTRDDVVLELDQQASWSASATFSSGATLNYDDKVSWSSDAPTIVAVSDAGQVTALAEGVAHISATYKSHQDTKTVTASTATLQSIEFYPSLTTIDECSSSRVRARGTYSDGSIRHLTKKLSWQSSDDSLATIIVTDDSYAQITTHLEGNVTISASDESGRSNSTPIVIEDALSGLSLTPSSLTLKTGESAKFTASGQFNDGTFMDVSDASEWALAADEQSAFVDLDSESPDAGRVTAVAIGEAVLSASCGGLTVSQAGTVTVSDVITLTG